ncbi:MAG: sensor histidine kinase [Candidatus Binatia bacterium]
MRLRGQYTFIIGGLVCACLLVLGGALLAEQRRYSEQIGGVASAYLADSLERQIETHGIAIASALADRLVTPLYHHDYRLVAHEAAEQRSYPDIVSATVVDAAGVVIGESDSLDESDESGDSRIELPWVREALATGKPASRRESGILRVAAPAVAGGHVLGAALVELSMDSIRGDIEIEQAHLGVLVGRQSTSFSLTGLALGILLVTLSVLLAAGVAGRLSRPVVAFAAHARRIGRGEVVQSDGLRRRDEIGDLARAFEEMATTLRQTTVSKDYFDNVLRSMADMLLVADARARIVTANPSCLAELGCDEETLRGTRVEELLPGFGSFSDRPVSNDPQPPRWFELRKPGGGHIPVRVSAAPLRDVDGRPTGYVFVMQNVAERMAAEKQIERSLVEKEILLREIHHRVKNNLQIISSMLNLQGERSADAHMREVFQESEVRIRAMALVHEQLYRSGDLAHVDLAQYLDTLAQQVIRYFGRGDCAVDVRVEHAIREVSVDQAIPIGLIVNELIANSVQHGFASSRAGHITVELSGDTGGRRLSVCDDGAGFPESLDIETTDSLGLKLVLALTEQLGGRFSMTREGGTRCVVELPPAPTSQGRVAA